jgi:hypothetical protein
MRGISFDLTLCERDDNASCVQHQRHPLRPWGRQVRARASARMHMYDGVNVCIRSSVRGFPFSAYWLCLCVCVRIRTCVCVCICVGVCDVHVSISASFCFCVPARVRTCV